MGREEFYYEHWKEDDHEIGLEKGQEEAKAAISKNLLSKGSTAEFVREITGLEATEIIHIC